VKPPHNASRPPRRKRGQKVQPGAKPQFRNVKPVPKPRRQVIAPQKHMPRFRQAIVETEIGVIEPHRHRHLARAPNQVCGLVLHGMIL